MVQFIQKNNYEATNFDGEWIVLNTDDFTITKLNGTGGFCWNLLQEAQTVESLRGAVREEFGLQADNQEDIDFFLSQLLECGIIRHVTE
ncbi:PqqD family protein [Bacillus sp. T3]|uniref:PqqD family protein n=1 Tax=Bacillus sp. T3 TaxID=467262 RepID=UPI002980A487|nr:PqqD family protein [Bacillus sp. T3]